MTESQIKKVADTLVGYCQTQQEARGLEELYDADAVSVEAFDMPGGAGRETKGVDGIRGKHAWWAENFEVHGGDVQGPFIHGDNQFAVIFEIDATNKQSGERSQMREVAIYTTNDAGKIAREEFYY